MLAIIVFIIFFILHTYVFMYQRTTLAISRHGESPVLSVQQLQIYLTPTWLGALGWISTIGLYGSYVLLWLQFGWFWPILLFFLDNFATALIPIPSHYFYGLVLKHLQSEYKKGRIFEPMLSYFKKDIQSLMETGKVP